MGIDVHGLNFLRYCKKFSGFGKTASLGRQELHAAPAFVRKALGAGREYRHERYCEAVLLEFFGSTSVDSIDNSDYEAATIIHDMNSALPQAHHASYDTVIDGGCLEHVYDIVQALKNCSLLCRPGGQLIHVLPANNFCGHGFWQFSPELFFSLYSEKNGYRDTEVFLADLSDEKKWFKVRPPKDGKRVDVHSPTEIYVLVRTVRAEGSFSHGAVQQSDYVSRWDAGQGPLAGTQTSGEPRPLKAKDILKKTRLYRSLAPHYRRFQEAMRPKGTRLDRFNPGLEETSVTALL